jgi:hypothetical protein
LQGNVETVLFYSYLPNLKLKNDYSISGARLVLKKIVLHTGNIIHWKRMRARKKSIPRLSRLRVWTCGNSDGIRDLVFFFPSFEHRQLKVALVKE